MPDRSPFPFRPRRRTALALALVLAGTGLVGITLVRPHGAAAMAEAAPQAVRAVTVAGADAAPDGAPRYAATIHYDREATLAFRVPGRIASLPVHPGDRIGTGALIAAIEPDAYAAAEAMRAADATRNDRDAARIGRLVAEGATSPAAAADARDAAHAAAAGLAAARYDLASTRLVAPFAGIVLARVAQAGETVAAGSPVLRLADSHSPLIAVADIPAEIAARLSAGARAQVRVAGSDAALDARVWHVAGAADARSGLVSVELRLDRAGPIASGSPASVSFAAASAVPAADARQRIPAEALIDAGVGSADVWVIDGSGRARRRTVRFYGFDDRDAIVGGLPAGTRVITTGAGFVAEGQAVQVTA